ncbi:hypothetical protein [uncultured Novosphingobium sp.]|uniref:hypothetical protein n=1 Tax=uncultured Novosphingobium sp. TaxID=292277 RepID=UPI00374992F4
MEAFIGISIVLMVVSFVFALISLPFWFGSALSLAVRKTKASDEYTRLVIDLLAMGKDWKCDAFYATHPCGVRLWIASGRSHLKYEDGKGRKLSRLDRYRLWHAVDGIMSGRLSNDAHELAEAIVRRYNKEKPA